MPTPYWKCVGIPVLGIFLGIVLLSLAAQTFNSRAYANKKIENYKWRAVDLLALRASLRIPYETEGGFVYWSRQNACMKTTNLAVGTSSNGKRIIWEDWPAGDLAGCGDFFPMDTRQMELARPENCYPALPFRATRDPADDFVIAVAQGVPFGDELSSGTLNPQDQKLIQELEELPVTAPNAQTYLKAGGLSWVNIDTKGSEACEGFTLFRYRVSIADPAMAIEAMDNAGYFVGKK